MLKTGVRTLSTTSRAKPMPWTSCLTNPYVKRFHLLPYKRVTMRQFFYSMGLTLESKYYAPGFQSLGQRCDKSRQTDLNGINSTWQYSGKSKATSRPWIPKSKAIMRRTIPRSPHMLDWNSPHAVEGCSLCTDVLRAGRFRSRSSTSRRVLLRLTSK
jgi:hypothetical protein